ncbi:DUF3304 domain-containing protein [Duganella sp. FT134W]|uniref:DUF3304 domain-containing protein n=1 Tax=Duganella margarita TaxID=2692170 RepID=A0A7X4GZP6_9BURK|nr:DUF3304 domain-containing protein [Duganella margarita]MYM72672.1 DUF3304 domain-containing protein [Duganella margarita]
MSTRKSLARFAGLILGAFLYSTSITAFAAEEMVSVSIHGVNYSADDFTYVVEDPRNSKNIGGGEIVGPFEAGGIVCCYELPKDWRSGIQIKVNVKFQSRINSSLPASKGQYSETVEVPPYVDGKPGELWVVRAADGKISVVSSDYSPNHPKWPGSIKNWPQPSLEYKRYRWRLYVHEANKDLVAANRVLENLKQPTPDFLKEQWDYDSKYNKNKISKFSGPDDEKYLTSLRERFTAFKQRSEQETATLEKNKP